MTDTTSHWQPIATAPRDRKIRLRAIYDYAGEPLICNGIGQFDDVLQKWSGSPTEWMDLER